MSEGKFDIVVIIPQNLVKIAILLNFHSMKHKDEDTFMTEERHLNLAFVPKSKIRKCLTFSLGKQMSKSINYFKSIR